MSLAEGDLVDGRYRVVRAIAEGGMGIVYEVEHVGLGKRMALKLLRSDIAAMPGLSARFEREARTTSMLEHPRVVRVIDFGRASQGLYLVLDLLRGRSLRELLDDGPLPIARAVAITAQILEGLGAAHAAGLIHRDLKPENIFLCEGASEDVRILDFGIAAMRGNSSTTKLTQAGTVLGTPAYMAPEQAMGETDLDARADLHAVGVMLYEMLAGEPPYQGDNYNQVLHAVLRGKPRPIETLLPEVPPVLRQVISRAVAPARNDRYASAAAMREALLSSNVTPEFRLPSELTVTHLSDDTAPLRAVSPPTRMRAEPLEAVQPLELDRAASEAPPLELDRPVAPSPSPVRSSPRRASAWPMIAVVALLALGGAGLAVWQPWKAKTDAFVDLVHVTADTQVTLDGTPIKGRRLQLPRSNEVHVIELKRRHEPMRVLRFISDRDQTLDASSATVAR